MHPFTGTFRLVRLALRRDRIKLPAWILAITGLIAANIPSVLNIYGKTVQSQTEYATTAASSVVSRSFGGPIQGSAVGEIVTNEVLLFTAIAVAFMSTLAVVRHTRQNEETGRAELIGSAVLGRHASLVAALLVAVLANIVLAGGLFGILVGNGLPAEGSIGIAAAIAAVGIAFAAVAAVTSQISESARGANNLAALAIGVAFLLRAVGDGMGQLTADRLGVVSSWPSWLSPLGWSQQIHPYTTQRWWIFGLLAGFALTAVLVAFYLNAHRDIGRGMVEARKGPAHAPRALLSAWGLARRLQRGTLIGWSIAVGVTGAILGLISKEFGAMFEDNPDLQAYIQSLGGTGGFEDVFFAAMFAIMAICIAGYAVQALQRMRSEEVNGTLEPLLATSTSRWGWALSHIGYTWFGTILLIGILGVTSGLSFVLFADGTWPDVWRLTAATFAQLPAILAIAGVFVLLFGAVPRAVIAITWSAFGFCLLIGQFGELLKLPQYALNVSPFTHIPAAPSEPIVWLPLISITVAAVALTTAGLWLFRKRNITIG